MANVAPFPRDRLARPEENPNNAEWAPISPEKRKPKPTSKHNGALAEKKGARLSSSRSCDSRAGRTLATASPFLYSSSQQPSPQHPDEFPPPAPNSPAPNRRASSDNQSLAKTETKQPIVDRGQGARTLAPNESLRSKNGPKVLGDTGRETPEA